MTALDDTIAAISSAAGGAARGIVRLSGPDVIRCLLPLFAATDGTALSAIRRPTAIAGRLTLPGLISPLPCDLYLWPTARSYTRQPAAELHTLGSPPLLQATLEAVCATGARLAGPGEFTLRAFLAGRIDLTQAEAVLGVIEARDRRALSAALSQLAGGLAGPLGKLRDELLELLAHLEASLDFVEEDIEFLDRQGLRQQLANAAEHVQRVCVQLAERGEARDVFTAVLVGEPNVGKSSLFNALAGSGRALVSPVAGTTTDYLSVELDLDGVTCRLMDTAGREEAPRDGIGGAAQRLRAGQQEQADIELLCFDAGRHNVQLEVEAQQAGGELRSPPGTPSCFDATQPANVLKLQPSAGSPTNYRIIVLTKCDQAAPAHIDGLLRQPVADVESTCERQAVVATSARRGQGIAELRALLRAAAVADRRADAPIIVATAVRCRDSLRRAAETLSRAGDLARTGAGDELIALEIRSALDELGQVAGAVYTDDLLDRIFSSFCIGK